jgi:SAM-dependent methyltransferase
LIDPKDVIRRYSVEELCATAEEYFRRVDDPAPLMGKPFTSLREAPEMLHNLGLLLRDLHLGRTMTVLDFGAGTCWLSRLLTQLNCQVICCDASRTALEIGKRLFSEYPLIGTAVYQPTFLWFDGHTIELQKESVDRIICFDALHHVPNLAEVIGEFGRVLRRGGIAGFSEPGRLHAQNPQAQYEMANHKVLENNVDVSEIFRMAKDAGFTKLSLAVALDMTISLDEHDVLFAAPVGSEHERLKSELWNQAYNTMTNRAIFFLHKGPLGRDSRGHIGLAHRIQALQPHYEGRVGETISMSFIVKNVGEASWLETNSEIFGIVRLGSHLYDADGTLISIDFSRHDLPRRVEPDDTLTITAEVSMTRPGRFRLAFDLVAEGVTWFENQGSIPAYVTANVR